MSCSIHSMWPFSTRSKLLRDLDKLAFSNDKGAIWLKHSMSKIDTVRTDNIAKIATSVQRMKVNSLPLIFLSALVSGELAKDPCGEYFDLVKNNKVEKGAI